MLLPAPVPPHTATISPGCEGEVDARAAPPPRPGRRSGRLRTRRRAARPAARAGRSASGSRCTSSSQANVRPAEAIARWARFRIQPSASSGQVSCSRMVLKRTNWPIVSRPVDHVAAAEEDDRGDRERRQEEQRRQVLAPRRPPGGTTMSRTPGRLAAEPLADVVLAPERLHHLDADDGLVGGLRDVALGRLHPARDRHHQVGEAPGDEADQRRRDAPSRASGAGSRAPARSRRR